MSFVYASRATYCAICHRPPALCRCARDGDGVVDLARLLNDDSPEAQRAEAMIRADGYVRHGGHVYALTMEAG